MGPEPFVPLVPYLVITITGRGTRTKVPECRDRYGMERAREFGVGSPGSVLLVVDTQELKWRGRMKLGLDFPGSRGITPI